MAGIGEVEGAMVTAMAGVRASTSATHTMTITTTIMATAMIATGDMAAAIAITKRSLSYPFAFGSGFNRPEPFLRTV